MNQIGALYELSGVQEIGRRKRKTKEEKKHKKEERKEKRKKVFKKIAKVGLAPARDFFLLAVRLNLLKLATKLARGYQKDPTKIKNFWSKFNGDWDKLKNAISKGSKVQINGYSSRRNSEIGSATLLAIATATPIIVALIPLLKDLKANGDSAEEKELEDGVNLGLKTLAENPDVEKLTAKTDEDFKSGKVEDGPLETQTEIPNWVLPVALVGGAGLVYFAVKK